MSLNWLRLIEVSVFCWRRKLGRVELARIQHALAETLENSQDQLLRVPLRSLRPALYQMDMPMVRTVGRPPPVQTGEGDLGQDVIIIRHPASGLPNETGTILVDTAGAEPALVPSLQSDARKFEHLSDRWARPRRS